MISLILFLKFKTNNYVTHQQHQKKSSWHQKIKVHKHTLIGIFFRKLPRNEKFIIFQINFNLSYNIACLFNFRTLESRTKQR